mmetsp:Transcript_23733/g.45238  ORF Transcript_23733/g.45238 Transcript_23733/m.45238 type:complete len:873 (+) Transcript_23733:125-2743(+)|eukprot:CAMPEP_0201657402 /NCGR_PEP_ID=MMETSP0494-20130426/671_1 /ASSEMBLY_ACC=CAM_ASM_000839 /TAXON_ID=420259 /ORGANISM="Thalassiosira gravida, Strain GMp14c1" /LENGTH=872 /DNA_ID=CAMNT_0048134247 /DNA_START=90 /DNA_END=2708 /DNA_ORIENTATION=-
MLFWKTDKHDDNADNSNTNMENEERSQNENHSTNNEDDSTTTTTTTTQQQQQQRLPNNEDESTTQQQAQQQQEHQQLSDITLSIPSKTSSSSASKQAVHIMNITSGLCADPLHFHSFATIGSSDGKSGWTTMIPSPQSIFAGAFQKCAACHGRLGGSVVVLANNDNNNVANDTNQGDDGGTIASASASVAATSSSVDDGIASSGMLRCVACGVYAHRSCAFARPRPRPRLSTDANNATTTSDASCRNAVGVGNNSLPLCEVNLIEIEKLLGMSREDTLKQLGVVSSPSQPQPTASSEINEQSSSSSWSIFGNRSQVANEDTIQSNNESKASLNSDHEEEQVIPNNNPVNKVSDVDAETAIKSNNEKELGNSELLLKEKKEPTTAAAAAADESETKPIPPKPGVIETSINLIKKTTETTKNIPKASAIGMVAGGAAGLVIAGPAGIIVGSQIGRTVLAVGAVVEGGIGISVLAMSLAAAANFHLSGSEKGEKERELKLKNGTLVLVRPDIDVDPVWGEYAEEARKCWMVEKMNDESSSSSSSPTKSSSCGSFGLGNIGSLFQSINSPAKKEDCMRYRKDSDIIKADASELPMREKVFLLVNRILNDKMSLPGYLYRSLIMKHKRRIVFGSDVGRSNVEAKSEAERDTAGDSFSANRSSRQDAHGVIKHVAATLLEVRPGLASSPAMTELSAAAVEVLVFGELYDDVFREIILQTEEKDESLLAKGMELRKKCDDDDGKCASREGSVNNEASSSISQSAIGALRSLPRAHTSTDKLLHCVEFLEYISEHFSSLFRDKCIDADTLLMMVCQHVVAASIEHLHAEVAFIEEFSRDEQLLSGKEGYALITLQASLHYLDSLDELPSDIIFPESSEQR